MMMTRPPYHLLDLPAVPFDSPSDWEVVPPPGRRVASRRRHGRERDLRELPEAAQDAVRIALTRLIASL